MSDFKPVRLTPDQRHSYYALLLAMYGPCEDFRGYRDARGYGWTKAPNGKRTTAHRAAWEAAHGTLPADVIVRHKCDHKACVRLDHLTTGTAAENARDAIIRGTVCAGETHWNHRLTEDQVRAIRASTERTGVLAERYGVSGGLISKVRAGTVWSHIRPRPVAA